ncbi:MAG: glycosyltransferase, partial [Adhaeribacter sp.]|nr:glycosyltransferase [Adhaeribacter sp.]
MNNYNKINNIVGWIVFLIAVTVYGITLEPTASFWDAGEFIACSYKLLVPHPPGAPFYLLVGRIFSMFAGDNVLLVAPLINFLSGLVSAFTVLFLFWAITIMARKLVVKDLAAPTVGQTLLIMGSGAVGALAFTFSDSFWFSAVEAEVYGMSAFFSAFVFWAMLKWEGKASEVASDKWLILIAYMVGLSIGVHLLNLLAIPALAFIYYFRKAPKTTRKGAIITFLFSTLVIVIILWGIIPGLPSLAGSFEVFFINNIGLPFGSGIFIFLALFIGLIVYGFRYSFRHNKRYLNTALLCLVFILIGYSSYMIIPIRSAYDPPIDENDPENIVSFVSYLKREQYGDRPLLFGPQFTAEVIDQEQGDPRYIKGKDKYEIVDYKVEPVYDPKDMSLLPRIYSNQPMHIQEYKKWVSIEEGRKPTMGENLSFLMKYQLGHMYWRYFLWNFVGRDSDVQNAGVLWPAESNQGLPERVAESRARNNFYMLPLLLGMAGLIFQLRRNQRDAFVVGLIFLFTGLAIALYLNQPPVEPRERDYTFAGSFFAFSIWIGLGVLAVADLLQRIIKSEVARAAVVTLLCLSVPIIMMAQGWDDHDRSDRYNSVDSAKNLLSSLAPNAIIFTNGDNDTFPLWYAQEVEGFRTDVRVAVLSYLNTDWYIDQMKRRAYKSQPLPISLEIENYRQGTNDYLPFVERPEVKGGIDLKRYIGLVKENHEVLQVAAQNAKPFLSFPTKIFTLDVDKAAVIRHQAVPQDRQGQILDQLSWNVGKSAIEKKHLVILDILATNNWERPVYFSTTTSSADYLNLQPYFQLEGLAYRIVPVKNPDPESEG